jgi:hypothetical protein
MWLNDFPDEHGQAEIFMLPYQCLGGNKFIQRTMLKYHEFLLIYPIVVTTYCGACN